MINTPGACPPLTPHQAACQEPDPPQVRPLNHDYAMALGVTPDRVNRYL